MSTKLNAGRRISLAVAAAAVAVAYGASAAEPATEVIVEAPRVARSTEHVSTLGAPVQVASIRYRVSYADLNLASASGAQALEKRVHDAAVQACKDLDAILAPGPPTQDNPPCIKSAVDGGMLQAREAIARAERKAP
jgi:UrcA family protein